MDPSPKLRRAGVAAGALLATVSLSHAAHATNCDTLPSPVYAVGGSSPLPIFAKVATALSQSATPVTLVYQSAGKGGCDGVNAIVSATPTLLTGTANYWDATGTQQSCNLQDLGTSPNGVPADFGVSGNYAPLCTGSPLPGGVKEFLGPIQDFDFIVPTGSQATAISAEAAYFVYGFGASPGYQVTPWTAPLEIYTRSTTATAAIIIALGIGLPIATFSATTASSKVSASSNSVMLSDVAAGGLNALGFVSGEVADGNTSAPPGDGGTGASIKVLAYQHTGQSCGWLPSSTPNVYDKINVRNGLYALWSPVHFIAAVDSTGTPSNLRAKSFIGYFTGAPPTGIDVDALTTQAGATLDCAMEVTRTTDMGPLEPYTPAAPCGCFFEKNATGVTSCQACTTSATCPASATHCTKGYCEVN
jgi:hypothetical protein